MAKAYLVGGGIAALSAAAFLIRDGGFAGGDIHIFEEQDEIGGSLDAAGTPEAGYTMRGGRMFEAQFRCTFDLLSGIPSLDDPAKSVTQDIFDSHDESAWDDAARLVRAGGLIVDGHAMGFTERHRLELVKCLAEPERTLDGKRITDCFDESFFRTDFWYMWCTTFAFEPWHSAIEFRRYLRRFVHLFPEFETMSGIYRTRYNQYDSIVRPLTAWLVDRGVQISTGRRVTDLAFRPGPGTTVERIYFDGAPTEVPVGPEDLVFVTNGSMTADSVLGSHTAPPNAPHTSRSPSSFLLWHRIARGREDFGHPKVFDRSPAESTWESFTVTAKDPAFLDWMEKFTGRATGRGGLLTLPDSNWLLTIVVNRQPVYQQQPEGVSVWWGYGLFPDKPGNFVKKPMRECSGAEILQEVLHHLEVDDATAERVGRNSTVIPCLMPYITSQFLVRSHGDRPQVVPQGSVNLAFIGQFAEVPDDVVFTVEYSVRTAWTAVAQLLKLDKEPPAVHKGHHDPHVLAQALHAMHRR
ncbi:oleate hydratase [Streptomyces pluripotens]|uniref:Oleate hydratase n=1 Tax=Streptomyces pluripotens TaxID=1355015 RepID=A0A221NS31_9ACTN|nr:MULTISPECIES: oleate hydratase [Streptomyces]ASN22789.1 oleate hydratase [Streptomyces pluripotens]KIE25420.1 oleate hydratase [Streptomyces sp. MUSC 125]MCH0558179.1 oleate hydratase [Streptomyces sp. MUM 16J]